MQPAPAPAPAPRAVSPELAAAEARRDKLLANATRDWRRLAYDLSADDPSKAPMVKSFISRHGNLEVREGDIVIKVDPPEVKDAYAWLKHWGVDPP
jgi:hypothetical protein